MRGGRLHNLLADRLAAAARDLGFWTRTEAFLGSGYGDLVIGRTGLVILIEVELEPRRVPGDIAKAGRIGASELWIVAGDRRVAARIGERIGADEKGQEVPILVFVQPEALQRLAQLGGLLDRGE